MSVRLGKFLLRSNRRWISQGRGGGGRGRGNSGSTFDPVENVEGMDRNNMIDPPLGEKDDYPSYVQPNEEKNSTYWSELFVNRNSSGREDQKNNKKSYSVSYPFSDNYAYNVPYNYKIVIPSKNKKVKKSNVSSEKERKETSENEQIITQNEINQSVENIKEEYSRNVSNKFSYTDFTGFRNPTLETLDNYRYWQDSGFKKFLHRIFPIKLPDHKKVNPLLREYIYFLHSLDPFRFTFKKLSERYFLSQNCIQCIYKEECVKRFLRDNQLCDDKMKRISKKEAVLKIKELIYAKKLGYKDIGDFENIQNEDDQFQGHKNTFDVINRQVIQVESISSFPLPDRRDPVPKRVDVDIPVYNSANVKIMNWVNPNDKVIF
ncbi:hypothetical protein, conserved [Plasmodium gonderi]|uniref:Uncharacterized protein n=1 Tax=Plasmodium gonderi TaxID=77519 RepID=A0A1Y1J9D4_PLAGO|nr:hypothetical protein, conserved [Plasmodium gonderi]GAW79121.1 hypothetical protein, conserved [Plasmodium gonderi]